MGCHTAELSSIYGATNSVEVNERIKYLIEDHQELKEFYEESLLDMMI